MARRLVLPLTALGALLLASMAMSNWCNLLPVWSTNYLHLSSATPLPKVSRKSMDKVIKSQYAFAFDVYRLYEQNNKGKNFAFSPPSLYSVLSMVLKGARSNSETELLKALYLHKFKDPSLHAAVGNVLQLLRTEQTGVSLLTANKIYVQSDYGVVPQFTDSMFTDYISQLDSVNFETSASAVKEQINRWVSGETKEKINDLIPDGVLKANTRMVLINALYFKGLWEIPFKPNQTAPGKFLRDDGSEVQVPMMSMTDRLHISYSAELGFQAVRLDFQGGDVALFAIKPINQNKLSEYVAKLSHSQLRDFINGKFEQKRIMLIMPRFKLDAKANLNTQEYLPQLGIKDIFSKQLADLSGLSTHNDLFISPVIHKAVLEVNEEGAEGAAATAAVAHFTTSMPFQRFKFNEPFLVLVAKKQSSLDTYVPIFMGRINDPSA